MPRFPVACEPRSVPLADAVARTFNTAVVCTRSLSENFVDDGGGGGVALVTVTVALACVVPPPPVQESV